MRGHREQCAVTKMNPQELGSTLMAAAGGQADELALVVSPSKAMRMLDCGRTRLYQLLDAGELDSYLDGRARRITVESILRRIKRKLEEAKTAK